MSGNSNSSHEDRLVQLLRRWSTQNKPTSEDLDRLCLQVQNSLAETPKQSPDLLSMPRQTRSWLRPLVAISSMAVAASLLIGVAIWNWPQANRGQSQIVTQEVSVKAVDFRHQKQVLENLLAVYAESLTWVAEAGDLIQVELENAAISPQPESKPAWLLIRLAVERRQSNQLNSSTSDMPVWQVDMAVRNEQVVHLKDLSSQFEQLSIWPCVMPNGLVVVDTHFDSGKPSGVDFNETNLFHSGSRTRLIDLDEEHALWQYVEVISPT